MRNTALAIVGAAIIAGVALVFGRTVGYGAGARDTFAAEHPKTVSALRRASALQHRIDLQVACVDDVKKAIKNNLSGVTLYSFGKVFAEESNCNKASGFGYVNRADVQVLINAM
jgi:hypothetical protein